MAKTQEVLQESKLGRMAMSALATKFDGPPYDLSDLKVIISQNDKTISINFYDMEVTLNSNDEHYKRMKEFL